ncbi:hypothetical protein [Pseudophaeobacter arcticus]|uniref:hypothetical protein n=1 Tax=Pseudophaeobacter arcticus TaxID=385492 RepID=UPI003A97E9D0
MTAPSHDTADLLPSGQITGQISGQITGTIIRRIADECEGTAKANHRLAQGQFQTIWILLLGGLVLVLVLPFIIQKIDDLLSTDRKLDPAIMEDAKAIGASLHAIQREQQVGEDAVRSRFVEISSQLDEAGLENDQQKTKLEETLLNPLTVWDETGPYQYEDIRVALHRRLQDDTIVGLAWDGTNSPAQAVLIEWLEDGTNTSPFPSSGDEDIRFAAIIRLGTGDLLVGHNSGFKSGKPFYHITQQTSDGWQEVHAGPGTLRDIKVLKSGEVIAFGSRKISETSVAPLLLDLTDPKAPQPLAEALALMPPNSTISALLQREDGSLLVYGASLLALTTSSDSFSLMRSATGAWGLADGFSIAENSPLFAGHLLTQLVAGTESSEGEKRPLFLAIATNFRGPGLLLSSLDGLAWKRPPGQTSTEISALTYSEKYGFVAAGIATTRGGKIPQISHSQDGVLWHTQEYERFGSKIDAPFTLLTSLPSGEILGSNPQANLLSFPAKGIFVDTTGRDQEDGRLVPYSSLVPPGTNQILDTLENLSRRITTLQPLLKDQEELVNRESASSNVLRTSIDEYEKVRVALDQSLRNNELTRQITQTATRVAVIGMLIYLVQIVVNRYRYLQRLASFYQARAQALRILADQGDLKLLEGITLSDLSALLSPDSIGFDSAPEAPTSQLVALLQAGLRANNK